MKKPITDKVVKTVGIDLGKSTFHLYGENSNGGMVFRKKLSREKLIEFMANLPPCLVGIEACGGSHFLARKFQEFGHEVKMMAPQFVKPYVKSNKNDSVDAEAVCEAVQRPNMRFVPIKSVEQQDMQSLHRARSLAVANRTALINQIRGLLMENGIVLPRGAGHVRSNLPEILEMKTVLTAEMRELLTNLRNDLVYLDECILRYQVKIEATSRQHAACILLETIPGIGPMIATALVAAVGDVSVFKNGREMAAWLGLVPRQHSTGGKERLLGISKRGDTYLRMMLIHGARAVLRVAGKKTDRRSQWIIDLKHRRGENIAAVALANKNVRTVWAMLAKGEKYQVSATI